MSAPSKKLQFFIVNNYSQFASKDVWDGLSYSLEKNAGHRVLRFPVDSMHAFLSDDLIERYILSSGISSLNNFTHIIFIGSAFMRKWVFDTIKKCNGPKTIYWSVEDPHAFDQNSRFMDYCDYYFTNEKTVANKFPGKAYYLPTAGNEISCETPPCKLEELADKSQKELFSNDIIFCGNIYPNRKTVLEPLVSFCEKEKIRFGIFGVVNNLVDDGKSPLRRYVKIGGNGIVDHKIITYGYGFAKFAINIERDPFWEYDSRFSTNRKYKLEAESLNPRAYEIALCGGALQLIDDKRKEIFEKGILEDGKHCVIYTSTEDLIEKIKYYREHEEERQQIVKAAREHALANHTYASRAMRMLRIIDYKEGRLNDVKKSFLDQLNRGNSNGRND